PQMHWQMFCTSTTEAALTIIEGGKAPVIEWIGCDEDYLAELCRRAEDFMKCVWSLTPPVALPAVAAPVPAVREVDMSESNLWASEAGMWLQHRDAARRFTIAERELKALVPSDARRAYASGVEIRRDKASRLSIRESGE